MSDESNLNNPLNARRDEETRNAPHTTPIPAQAEADELFDDSAIDSEVEQLEKLRPNCRTEGTPPRNP